MDRVRAVMEGVARTKSQYSGNLKPRLNTFPIPFFGNILTAKVLTIGVNPSSGEFIDRNWPVEMDGQSLTGEAAVLISNRHQILIPGFLVGSKLWPCWILITPGVKPPILIFRRAPPLVWVQRPTPVFS